ncbi:acyltransferase family protein [Cylindrospermum sp. FACHB-282]|uniref:acyltransferase family protein n=1 Tax=Cylindrospermum sp. FACHB-282 TaxID=2692794 RepID=UPI00168970F9|nr:acyltransferase [Cylindrospermum sp. FACHB-282]MBD2388124.1 acyltransferase [Cylindrospermum sp. FACHB-282]
MSPNQENKKKLNLLQVSRALASIIVLLFHANGLIASNLNYSLLSNTMKFGYSGVDFFFVLSGFIIFYIHKKDIGNKVKFKDFILKRLIRVYPIYWMVLIPRLLTPGKDISFLTCLTSITLFPYPSPPIVNVSWTLSYEIFFYFIFSLLILFGLKYLRPLIIVWLILISAYWSFHSAGIFSFPSDNLFLNFIFSYSHLEFCFGCLAAYIVTKYKIRQGIFILTLGVVLFVLSSIADVHILNTIADRVSASLYDRAMEIKSPFKDISVVYYGIPSMLILIGIAALDLNKDIRVPNILVYLGDASYSIYLVHGSVINISTNLIAKMNLQNLFQNDLSSLFIVVMALIGGCLVHSYIEKPLLKVIKTKIVSVKS